MRVGLITALSLAAVVVVPGVAIAQTSIRELKQQNSVTVSGEVVRVWGDEFILRDRTGEMLVEAETRSIRQADLKPGDRITVVGKFDDDSFEAQSMTTARGNTIYVFDD